MAGDHKSVFHTTPPGLDTTRTQFKEFILQVSAALGISANKIVIGGFSQGKFDPALIQSHFSKGGC